MIEVINSIYVGKCYRGKIAGGFMIHQVWRRGKSKNIFAIVQNLQTNKLKTVSMMSIYRAARDNRFMCDSSWFYCYKCKGSGLNKHGNTCARCDGAKTISIDVGYSYFDFKVKPSRRHKTTFDKLGIDQLIESADDQPESTKPPGSSKPKIAS